MTNQSLIRPYRFSVLRVALCGVLMSALVALCLYLHHTAFQFYHARLLDDESKTLAWFTEQIGFSLPFIVVCLFHLGVYHKCDRRDGVARREMMWEILIVAVLTYAVLLPYLSKISDALYINAIAAGETLPKTEGKVEITLLMELHEWFVRLPIPLGILLVFHGARARREIREPESEAFPEPMITVEEYEARKAAKASALDTTVASEEPAEAEKPAAPQSDEEGSAHE